MQITDYIQRVLKLLQLRHRMMITKQLNFILMERIVLISPLTSADSPWAVSWLCCIFYPELHIGFACHWAVRWCFYREPEPPASSSPSERFSQSSPERSSLTELPSPPTPHAPLTTLSTATATKPYQLKHRDAICFIQMDKMVHKSVLSLSVHPLQLLQWCFLSGAEINTEHIQN